MGELPSGCDRSTDLKNKNHTYGAYAQTIRRLPPFNPITKI